MYGKPSDPRTLKQDYGSNEYQEGLSLKMYEPMTDNIRTSQSNLLEHVGNGQIQLDSSTRETA